MVCGPCVAFFFQAYKMCRLRSSQGYSNFVSYILLIANLLRVPFWYASCPPTLALQPAPLPPPPHSLYFQNWLSFALRLFLLIY